MNVTQFEQHEKYIDDIANPGSERYILAYIFKYPDSIYDISMRLSPSDFSVLPNRILYETMLNVSSKATIDVQTVINTCRESSILGSVGGEEYVSHLLETSVSRDNLKYHLDIVKLLSVKRESYRAALSIIDDSLNENYEDIDSFLGRQQQRFIDISLRTEDVDKVVDLSEYVDVWLKKVSAINNEIPGLKTGFPIFDRTVGGLQDTRLYVVAARSKVGKSTLLMNWATNIAFNEGAPVLYIDTEMPTDEVIGRVLSRLSTVMEKKITTGVYSRDYKEVQAVRAAREIFKKNKNKFLHVYLPSFSVEHIYNLARKYKIKYGIKALFFDYIKLPDHADLRNGAEYQQLGYITNMLKNSVAGGLNLPVITAAQVNKLGAGTEEESETHVGGSDRILHYASYLMILRNKLAHEIERDGEACGNQVLSIVASRHGGSDYRTWIQYDRPILTMRELMNANAQG